MKAGTAAAGAAAGLLVLLAGTALAGPPGRVSGFERSSPIAKYLVGRVAQGSGDWRTAAANMSGVLALDPENRALQRQAFTLHLGEGQYAEALRLAAAMAEQETVSYLPALLRVADDLKAGRTAAALDGAGNMPNHRMGRFVTPLVLAWTQAAAGDAEAAVYALKRISDMPGFAEMTRLQAALIHDLGGNPDAAAELYADAEADGAPLRLVQLAGNFFARHGEADRARALYTASLERQPDTDPIRVALADLDRGDVAPIVADAADGLAEALFDLAAAMQDENSLESALLFARISLFLAEDRPLTRILVGDVLAERGRAADALAAYRGMADDPALSWLAQLRAADLLRQENRTDEAVALLETLAADRPDRVEALLRLGDIHRGADRFDAATAAYDAAVARSGTPDPRDWRVYYARAMAHDGADRWPQAEADLQQALALNPEQPYVMNYLGYSWVDRGLNLHAAMEMIERAVELRPDDGYIVDSLGWAKYKMGDFEGAIVDLERAVELLPLDPTINDHLGDAYWAVGRQVEARFQWRRAANNAVDDKELRSQAEAKLREGLPLPKTAASKTEPPAQSSN